MDAVFAVEALEPELFDADDFAVDDADGFAADFDAVAEGLFAVDFEPELFDDDALAECDVRPRDLRATRTGRFQPVALSARNVRGIEMMLSGLSTTAAATASARSARTSEITFAGRRARAACTRFVSSRTNVWRSGSIQIDVPV